MADLQEKYAIKMEKYCFFVPEDCLQMRITSKRKKTQDKCCMPEPNYTQHGQIQCFNYFSHIQNKKYMKRQQVWITHLNSLSAVDCAQIKLTESNCCRNLVTLANIQTPMHPHLISQEFLLFLYNLFESPYTSKRLYLNMETFASQTYFFFLQLLA